MARRNTISARWLTVVLVVALACSVAVGYALIRLTGGATAASDPSAPSSASAASAAASSGSDRAPDGSAQPDPTPSGSESAGASADSGAGDPDHPTSTSAVSPVDSIPSALRDAAAAAVLPGSTILLPAAWSGTADLTITVLGRCADIGGTSSYTLPADLALQEPVTGDGPIDDPNPFSLTLGITPTRIPGLSLYSATIDDQGLASRTWWLTVGPHAEGRTPISGVLISDQPIAGALPPNLLGDSETDLQPCESGRAVPATRTLAAGSTLSGWVSVSEAYLEVDGTTSDGEREVHAVVTLSRVS